MNGIQLSFCIPVMNRLGDLKATLRKNLDDNIEQRSEIEFLIVCFDKNQDTSNWINANFSTELESGYLRFVQSKVLTSWHFGKAKNAFHGLTRGRIYASLDGDNFTGKNGGRHIIDVFAAHDGNCVFHQFQGDWGDGTCGRLSLTMADYDEIGYDDDFLPRQWDELDAILSTLVRHPERRYVCYTGKSITRKSHPFARFLNENSHFVRIVEIDSATDPLARKETDAAVGQHKTNYVQDDERLKYSSIFNHLTSFYKNCNSSTLRIKYANELVDVQRLMAECIDPQVLIDWFLTPQDTTSPTLDTADIVLAACIRNEDDIEAWQSHYRRLGVTHFLLIDDNSDNPIVQRVSSLDTAVWRPHCGRFRYSKAFWIEILLRNFAAGCWVLTVDSDEYLDLPIPKPALDGQDRQESRPLRLLTQYAEQEQIDHFAGVLIDLAPGPESFNELREGHHLSRERFSHFQFRPLMDLPTYRKHNSVAWSYGPRADWAYRLDIRFRVNRAFDSLRKFPIFKMSQDIHLNQGFHDLIINGEKRSWRALDRKDLLLIRHYKLFNSQRDSINPESRPAESYHPDTENNLKRLRENLGGALRAAAASPFTYQYLCYRMVPIPIAQTLVVRIESTSSAIASDFVTQLNRECHIAVRLSSRGIGYEGGSILAPSFSAGVEWVRKNTPYTEVREASDSHVLLGVLENYLQ